MKKYLQYIFSLITVLALTMSLSACIQVEELTTVPSASSTAAVTTVSEPVETSEETSSSSAAETTETETAAESETETEAETTETAIDRDGSYTKKDDVALYIHTYGSLPSNFITKKEAEKLGWDGGSLEPYAPGKCIGGDRFGNYEGILPDGRYTECDINTLGKRSRGSKRIVFDTEGNIYYTEDHYSSFEKLY